MAGLTADQVKDLSKKAKELAADLDRNWLSQVLTAGLAILYLSDQQEATGLAASFKIPASLIELALPLVFLYLFARAGYLLNAYLETRRELVAGFSANDGIRRVQYMVHRNVSVFQILSVIVSNKENPALGQVPRTGCFLTSLRRLPYLLLVLFMIGVVVVNTGLGLYFSYDLVVPFFDEFALVVPVGVFVVLALLYLQFACSDAKVVNRAFIGIMVIALVGALALATIMISWDPLADVGAAPAGRAPGGSGCDDVVRIGRR